MVGLNVMVELEVTVYVDVKVDVGMDVGVAVNVPTTEMAGLEMQALRHPTKAPENTTNKYLFIGYFLE